VAVLFADIVDFTPYCETHGVEEVVANLQQLVRAYEDLTLKHGLQKITRAGDSFVAVGGLLKALDNPVLDCVRCGLQMLSTAGTVPARWHMRVGIHIGPVIGAVIGRRQYLFDVLGDTVNTAQRIQSHGIADAVNLSSEAWQRVSDQCEGESLGSVQVKGKGMREIIRVTSLMDGEP
jgi:adenylate cyclase